MKKVARRRYPVKGRRVRKIYKPKPALALKKYQGVKYFTEMFDGGELTPNVGGIFRCSLNSMINATQYFNLFDLGTITRFDVLLVPQLGDTVLGTSPQTGRIVWSSTQNIDAAPPVNELSILQGSDAKVLPLDGKRTITLRCYKPRPAAVMNTFAGSPIAVSSVRNGWSWIDTNSTEGKNLSFDGIRYFVSTPMTYTTYKIFIRVYAAFKEQD